MCLPRGEIPELVREVENVLPEPIPPFNNMQAHLRSPPSPVNIEVLQRFNDRHVVPLQLRCLSARLNVQVPSA